MGTDIIAGKFSTTSLNTELENARVTLRDVEDSIKRVFGKDPSELNTFQQRPRRSFQTDHRVVQEVSVGIEFDKQYGFGFGERRRGRERENDNYDQPNDKRRRTFGDVDNIGRKHSSPIVLTSRLIKPRDNSEEPEMDLGNGQGGMSRFRESNHQRLQSRVVSSVKEKSREEVLAEQREDQPGRARNRRMFSALLGTLHQFKQDETKLKEKEDKRAQIEAKLEEQAMQEKESVKKEKQKLIRDHKLKLTEIKRLEYKKHRLEQLEEWETKTKYLKSFIRTEAKPNIFYLPKIMNPIAECRLDESKLIVEEIIVSKRKSVLAELENHEEQNLRYFEHRQKEGHANAPIILDPLDVNMEDELKALMKDVETTEDIASSSVMVGSGKVIELTRKVSVTSSTLIATQGAEGEQHDIAVSMVKSSGTKILNECSPLRQEHGID